MYKEFIRNTDQAVVHLLLYCAHRDNVFLQSEYVSLGKVINALNADKHINLINEIENYYAYHSNIGDENIYLSFLVQQIGSTNRLSLYWQCVQLAHTDDMVSLQEETLLTKIAKLLYINGTAAHTLQLLARENSALVREKCF